MIQSRSMPNAASWLAVVAIFASPLLTGCGEPQSPTGTVQGQVTLDDSPYTGDAAVVFMSTDTGQGGAGNVQSDGTFALRKPLPVGSYSVFLGPTVSESPDGTMEPGEEKFDDTLPKKYHSETTTDVTVEVSEGENDVTVALTSS